MFDILRGFLVRSTSGPPQLETGRVLPHRCLLSLISGFFCLPAALLPDVQSLTASQLTFDITASTRDQHPPLGLEPLLLERLWTFTSVHAEGLSAPESGKIERAT